MLGIVAVPDDFGIIARGPSLRLFDAEDAGLLLIRNVNGGNRGVQGPSLSG